MTADFASTARSLGVDLDAVAVARFATYRDRVAGTGFNLTAVREPALIERRHFLESLAFARLLADRDLLGDETRVLDVGTGAGFPGLPLKIARPGLRLTLLDSHGKTCDFLRDLVRELGLEGVDVVTGRAEELGHDAARRETYDLVVARAVAPLPVLLEYALPFLRVGGHLAATKGGGARREIDASGRALSELGGVLVETAAFEPPQGMRQTVVIVRKTSPTPQRYPRRSGIPSKRPLE